MTLSFAVPGLPASKGSMRVYRRTDGSVGAENDNPRTSSWQLAVGQSAIATLARARITARPAFDDRPLFVRLHFVLPRPKSAPRRVVYPSKKPDLDKLTRAVFDALTAIAWRDDAQVIELYARKDFLGAAGGGEVGVVVTITDDPAE